MGGFAECDRRAPQAQKGLSVMPSPLQNLSGGLQPVELTRGDLAALAVPRTAGSSKAKRREVARLKAMGHSGVHIARAVRYAPRTVSQIARSQDFQDQFWLYMRQRDRAAIDVAVRIRLLAEKALDLLSYRLWTEGLGGDRHAAKGWPARCPQRII